MAALLTDYFITPILINKTRAFGSEKQDQALATEDIVKNLKKIHLTGTKMSENMGE